MVGKKNNNLATNLQPTCNQLATDCISRLAAIDVIENFGILDGYSDRMELIDRIKNLPSTQPEPNVHDLPKDTDCISRQAAVEALEKWEAESIWDDYLYLHRDEPGCEPPSSVVKALPSAQPGIIHCRDCKHWVKILPDIGYCQNMSRNVKILWIGDDFCSRAERKGGEAE